MTKPTPASPWMGSKRNPAMRSPCSALHHSNNSIKRHTPNIFSDKANYANKKNSKYIQWKKPLKIFSREFASPKSTLRLPGNKGPKPRVASLSQLIDITANVRPWKQPQHDTMIA